MRKPLATGIFVGLEDSAKLAERFISSMIVPSESASDPHV